VAEPRTAAALVILFVSALPGANTQLGARIQRLLASTQAARSATWGIQITNAKTGTMAYQFNPDRLLVPASGVKLFTTALALTRLGPDYRYVTRVFAPAPPDDAGVIRGPVTLAGGGDPNLSGRSLPFVERAVTGPPVTAIEDFADQVVARGVKRIEGDLVGDDTAYIWQPYPDTWQVEDIVTEDGPPASALSVYDNVITLSVLPGSAEGELASVALSPALEYYEIDNRVRTTYSIPRKVWTERFPGSRQVRIWGALPPGDRGEKFLLAIDDPALYAAGALLDALQRRGVTVKGKAVARHLFRNEYEPGRTLERPTAYELARRTSDPLVEVLRIIDKLSQNLHAELVLREVAKTQRRVGSFEAGLEELRRFLDEARISPDAYNLVDGSGLSRLNLASASAIVGLLRHMYASNQRDVFMGLLPVGARDGTLQTRFLHTRAAGRIRAKTGTLTHVSALSGYADKANGTVLAFSILANNYTAPDSDIRALIDKICILMLQ
jgi:D-alanyl-D-alanine carboxypeptidase/D-alanyl-D-alanine-endopeptidase (penicillin-binding protein 4)